LTSNWDIVLIDALDAWSRSTEKLLEASQDQVGETVIVSGLLEGLTSQPAVEALSLAIETFGDAAAAKRFLAAPNPFFEGQAPLAFALSHKDGRERLKTFLDEIEHGLPA
jgi:hypothetical protein